MREIKDKAILYAFDKAGLIVYSQILDLHEFYDGMHIWDSWEQIKSCGIVRLVGVLFTASGDIRQEFENTYDEQSGVMTGTRSYAHWEHLKTDAKYQKAAALFQQKRAQQADSSD